MVRTVQFVWLLLACVVIARSSHNSNLFRVLLRRARNARRVTEQSEGGFVTTRGHQTPHSAALPSVAVDVDNGPISMGATGRTVRSYCTTAPWKIIISVPGCIRTRRDVPTCKGLCTSFEANNPNGIFSKSCSCCKPIQYWERDVRIRCRDPTNGMLRRRRVKVPVVQQCECRSCASSS